MTKSATDTGTMLFGTGLGLLLSSGSYALVSAISYAAISHSAVRDAYPEPPLEALIIAFTGLFGLWAGLLGLWLKRQNLVQCQTLVPGVREAELDSESRRPPPGDTALVKRALTAQPRATEAAARGVPCAPTSDVALLKDEPRAPLTATVPSGNRIPRVIVGKQLLAAIHDYIGNFVEQKGPHLEIGGMVVGEVEPGTDAESPVVRLQGFIDAGPNADCQPASVMMDADYQGRMLQTFRLQHPRADVQGMFHLHPGTYDQCSSGDFEAHRQALAAAGTGTLVFIIVTRNNPKNDPHSLRLGDLKFDFFVMSRHLGPRYHKVRPGVAESALLQPEPLLARWAEIRGHQARADWALLQHIDGLGPFSLRDIADGEQSGLWLTAATLHHASAIHLFVRQDGALRLFLGNKHTPEQECKGPWTTANIGAHIFVSQLVLLALEHLRINAPPPMTGRHFTSLVQDKQRLVAEVRAMRERFGDEPQLHRKDDQVFWTCIARQNGREFPVEILYPPTFPNEPPQIRSLVSLKAGCPHVLPSDTICWIDLYGSHSQWNPGRDTAATALLAAHRWFACYLVWLTRGNWPDAR